MSQDKLNTLYISVCIGSMATKDGKVVTYHEKLPPKVIWLFIKVIKRDHVLNFKNYISSFTRFLDTKLGSVLTSGKRFRMQTPKLSQTSSDFLK